MSTETAHIEKKKTLTPKLRFKEFGENWQQSRLIDKSDKISDGIHTTPVYDDSGEYYFINGNNLINGEIRISENTKRINKEQFDKHKKDLDRNTILLSINGTIGSLAIYNNEKVILGKSACYIKVGTLAHTKFIYYLLQNNKTQNHFISELTGTTIKNLSLSSVKNCESYYPSLPEQQKIASFLSAVDEKIQQLTRKKELLEQYKKGVMQQLFSGKLRFKDPNGKPYSKWEEKKLGDVVTITKGKGISKTDIVEDGELECIRYGELYTHYKERITTIFSRTNLNSENLVLSEYNDIIIPSSGETQIDIARAACVLKDGVALGGDLNILKTKQNGIFLSYYINHSLKFDIAKVAQGNSVVHLYPSQLEGLTISIPSVEEQQKIASFLTALDAKIEAVANQITQAQTFKKGLLQQMFV